jgi:predicted site-specific integrase-resolvase
MNSILLNTHEAAEVLRISAITLHRWRKAGKGPPFIEMGRKVYYRRIDLENWIQQQQRQPESSSSD